jgi:hypothetical protein
MASEPLMARINYDLSEMSSADRSAESAHLVDLERSSLQKRIRKFRQSGSRRLAKFQRMRGPIREAVARSGVDRRNGKLSEPSGGAVMGVFAVGADHAKAHFRPARRFAGTYV